MVKKILALIFLFVFTLNGYSQLSKIHYIPPLTSSDEGNAEPLDQWFYISTPINGDVSFKIKPVGGTADQEISYIVNNANPKKTVVKTIKELISPVFSIKSYIKIPTIKIGSVEIIIDFIKFRFFKIPSLGFVSIKKKQESPRTEPICIVAIISKLSDSAEKNLL